MSDNRRLTCIIADDEGPARARLLRMIETAGLECVGEARNGLEAVKLINEQQPDVAFLDIRMPGLVGTEVPMQLNDRLGTAVIFTTAYSEYAVTAFELNAVDYLLKPIAQDRLNEAVSRVSEKAPERSLPAHIARAEEALGSDRLSRIFVRQMGTIIPISLEEISRFEAVRDYVRMYTERGRFFINLTMRELEARLPSDRFVRLHRSHIVNLDAVRRFRPADSTRLKAEMQNGEEITASRSGSQMLRRLGV